MPMIEGLGDEVTLVLAAFILVVLLTLAWVSTNVSDIPLLRRGVGIIVVELSERSNQATAQPDGTTAVGDQPSSVPEVSTHNNGGSAESPLVPPNTLLSEAQDESNSEREEISGNLPANISSITAEALLSSGMENLRLNSPGSSQVEGNSITELMDADESTTSTVTSPTDTAVASENGDQSKPDTDASEYLSEDEIRKRRLQYFQTGNPCDGPSNQKKEQTGVTVSADSESESAENCDTRTSSAETILREPSTETTLRQRLPICNEPLQTTSSSHGNSSERTLPDTGNNTNSSPTSSSPDSTIRVKLKYMNETQRLVYAKPLDTIGDFRRANFQTELADNKWVRFIYNGQDLRDDQRTLQACSIGDNCTMHCLITAHVRSPPSAESSDEEEGEDSIFGSLMYPLFAVSLLIVWYFRLTYRQYFSALSTVCLMAISFLLALTYISSLSGAEPTPSPPQTPRQSEQRHQHVD